MSCVLRVSGSKLPVDDILPFIPLSPLVVWRAGEPRFGPKALNLPDHQDSGFNLSVSDKDMDDLPGQIADAITFLQVNGATLSLLMNHPDIEALGLDFAVARREDTPPAISMHFPYDLINAASKFRLTVTISEYECSD